jgi:hypothetical protein
MRNTIILPSGNGSLPSSPSEVKIDPCGGLNIPNNLPDYPRYIRNGTFKSTVNGTLFVPTNAGSPSNDQITHGWYVSINGASTANADVATLTNSPTPRTNATHRQVISLQNAGGASSFTILEQRTSNIDVFSGKPLMLQFDCYLETGSRTIGVEFIYDEDNGTSFTISGGTFEITEVNQTFTVHPGIPVLSYAGLGADAKLTTRFWLQAGSDYNDRFGENVDNSAGSTFYFSNVKDGSLSHEPNEPEEEDSGSQYFYKDSVVRYIGSAGTTVHTTTVVGYVKYPVPLARTPLVSEITLTTQDVSGVTITPDRYGFGFLGTATDPTGSARILTMEIDITPPG